MPGRTIAIGDIHGCDVAFDTLLSKLEIADDDTLVVLGDACDRGPGTKACYDRLIELQQRCRLVYVFGNHDEMMLDAIDGNAPPGVWLNVGGVETLESYGGSLAGVPAAHSAFLKSAAPYWETDAEIFIHANLEPNVPLAQQTAEWLRWIKLTGYEQPHPSGKRVICGHTSQRSGLPLVRDGWVCIDTRVYDETGWLTALDVGTNQLSQANQQGAYRDGFSLAEIE